MDSIAYIIAWVIILIAFIIITKIFGSNTAKDIFMKTNLIIQYAEAFVSWARQFKSDLSGKEKMNAVIEKLTDVANKYGINITEEEIRAIAQKAYDSMKNKDDVIKLASTTGINTYFTEILNKPDPKNLDPLSEIDDTLKTSE